MQLIIEIIGYTGSILVVLSMLMTSVVKLRLLNSLGCVIFGIYALLIHSYPTAGMQFFLLVINIVSIYKIYNIEKSYQIIEISHSNEVLSYFLTIHLQDIKKFFPDFNDFSSADYILVIFSKDTPTGIFAGKKEGNLIKVLLDYTTPAYRDCSVADYLFKCLKEKGFEKVHSPSYHNIHDLYLLRMGFKKSDGEFIKDL